MLTNRILIVDDEPKLLSEVLPAYGYEVDVCLNGADAIKLLISKKKQYNLVILDINMPVMDGWQVLKVIRQDSGYDTMPVIMLTGSEDTGKEVTSFRSGADDYVTKPVRVPALLARIESLIKRYNKGSDTSAEILSKALSNEGYKLSAREKEVLKYVVNGDSNPQIAEALSIQEETVKAHLKSIFQKLEVTNRVQATVKALKYNLVS